MTVLKRYVLKPFIRLKYITANVVDKNHMNIVAFASTSEHAIKHSVECGRFVNATAASVVGEVLAMRLKVVGLDQGEGRGIHVDVNKEIEKAEKKGLRITTRIWALVDALKDNGIKVIVEGDDSGKSISHQQ